jgi:pilus assembly protein CpaE
MVTMAPSICIVSGENDLVRVVERAVSAIPSARTTLVDKPLATINGTAVKLAEAHDAIVVDLRAGTDVDVVAPLLGAQGRSAAVLALTDGSISLSEARQLNRLGVDEVLPIPFSEEDITSSLAKLMAARSHDTADRSSRPSAGIIGIAHAAGGSGATTVAVNLATALLGRSGLFKKTAQRRVAIVDLNPQFGDIATALDIQGEGGMTPLALQDTVPDETFVRSMITSLPNGLDVITAPAQPVPVEAFEADQIAGLLDVLGGLYDFVVLDLPAVLASWETPVMQRLDHMYLVTNMSVPALLHARRMIDFFAESIDDASLEIIANRDRKPLFGSRRVTDAQQVLGRPISVWISDDPRTARNAGDVGKPAVECHPRSPLARSIRTLAAKVSVVPARAEATLSATTN